MRQRRNRWIPPALRALPLLSLALAVGSSGDVHAAEVTFVEQGSAMRYLVPESDPGLEWTAADYDDSDWNEGTYGVGYGAGGMILTAVSEGTVAVYTRVTFTVEDLTAIESLHFGADFDDGYVAWLNGVEISRRSIPAGDPTISTVADEHESSNGDVADYSPIVDVTGTALPAVVEGENVLAVGVWNSDPASSDLALVPFLSANRPSSATGTPLCGTLAGETRLVAAESPYSAVCDLVVPKGSTLLVEAGVELRFDTATGLRIAGRLLASGEQETPIVLTAEPGKEWDGVTIDHGGDGDARESVLRHVRLSHAATLLAVRATGDSSILVEDCAFDFWDENALDWEASHGLRIRRSAFGMETPPERSDNEILHGRRGGALVEFCTFGPRTGYNDVVDIAEATWGRPVPTIRYNTFLGGEDDAIDYDTADGWIIGNLIMNYWPLPGSSSNANGGGITGDEGSRPIIANNVIYRCFHGIGFKEGARPLVVGNLVLDCHVGVTFYKAGCSEPAPHGTLYNNILWNNRHSETGELQNIVLSGTWWRTYCQEPGDQSTIEIRYSVVEGGWPGVGNIDAPPLLADPGAGDFSLRAFSPAIDAGFAGPFDFPGPDPTELAEVLGTDRTGTSPWDVECIVDSGEGEPPYRDIGPLELATSDFCGGERPFVRGEVNGDAAIDISDPIAMLLVLFAGAPASLCEDARDVDDDGNFNLSDPIALLDFLFRAGKSPPPPFPDAGLDPTDDSLTCEEG